MEKIPDECLQSPNQVLRLLIKFTNNTRYALDLIVLDTFFFSLVGASMSIFRIFVSSLKL